MISSPFIRDQAMRPPRKPRRYSAVWLASVPPIADARLDDDVRPRSVAAVGDPDVAADGNGVVGFARELLADPRA